MADYRTKQLTPYARYFSEEQVPAGLKMMLGDNDEDTFLSSMQYAIAKFELPLMPTAGAMIGATGETLTFELPAVVQPMWTVRFYDYDQDFVDALAYWKYNISGVRTELRFWCWGLMLGTAKIASFSINRPEPGELSVIFAVSGFRVYTAGSSDAANIIHKEDGTTDIHMLNWPFSHELADWTVQAAHSVLYGTEPLELGV